MRVLRGYIVVVDAINYRVGRLSMYLIFVLIGILAWSSISKTFFSPSHWTLEMAQFTMMGYFVLGGAYAIQMGANVRMDLLYSGWSLRRKAAFDAVTVLFLLFYLGVVFYGGLGSTAYSLGHFQQEPVSFFAGLGAAFVTGGPEAASAELGFLERSRTLWRPQMWPVKTIILIGVLLMMLQSLSELAKDVLRLTGREVPAR
ncbi:MAG: TRAP transporter small permease subunit [Pseudomonadota bacterium]